MNSRNPEPHACVGGSEPRLMTPDPGNPGNPRMSSKNADLVAIRVT